MGARGQVRLDVIGGSDTSTGDGKGTDEEDPTVPEFAECSTSFTDDRESGNIQSPCESPNKLSDVPAVRILQVRNGDWLATPVKRRPAHATSGFDCSADPVASSALPSNRIGRTSASNCSRREPVWWTSPVSRSVAFTFERRQVGVWKGGGEGSRLPPLTCSSGSSAYPGGCSCGDWGESMFIWRMVICESCPNTNNTPGTHGDCEEKGSDCEGQR